MNLLRNLPTSSPEQLSQMISIQPGRVVSMALSRSEHCQMMLMAFGAGESVSEESYFGDTLYLVIEGDMPLGFSDQNAMLHAGDCIMVPAHTLHAIGGHGAFKLLQITIQP